jgi:hypothetical protein
VRSLYPSPEYYDEVKESEVGWHVVCMGEMRNSHKILIRKLRVKFHFECLFICRIIVLKWILKEIGSEDAYRIHQAQDGDHWQAVVNSLKNAGFNKWCASC